MSFRLATFQIWCGVAALVLSGMLACNAQTGGKERGRSIEFSAPRSDDVTTNLNQLSSKKDGLKQLEEDLYKPLQSFAPKSSLEGVVAPMRRPPVRPAISSKRAKELLERQKDWIFMTPEDLIGEPTADGVLQKSGFSPDNPDKTELSPVERFYLRMATKRSKTKSPDQAKDDTLLGPLGRAKLADQPDQPNQADQTAQADDSDLPNGIKEDAEELLRGLFQSDSSRSPFLKASPTSDVLGAFGIEDSRPSPEQIEQHKKLMDEYHLILDPTWKPPTVADLTGPPVVGEAANPAPTFASSASPTPTPKPDLGSLANSAPKSVIEQQWDAASPILGPKALPDLNAQALGQRRPPPVLPKAETPKVVAPTFTAPRRAF